MTILSNKELREILERCKKRYKEDDREGCYGCLWFDKETGERHCTVNKDI